MVPEKTKTGLVIDRRTGRCQNYFAALCGGMRCHVSPSCGSMLPEMDDRALCDLIACSAPQRRLPARAQGTPVAGPEFGE